MEFQDQLNDVSRQAICVQTLIEEKLRQYKATLINIVQLEDASQKVSANLRRIEEHQKSEEDPVVHNIGTAKQLFEEQLDFLGRQKERLLQELPPLAPVASSEDLSSSDEQTGGAQDFPNSLFIYNSFRVGRTCEEYAIDLDAPPIFGILYHPCKFRAKPPQHRLPSRYSSLSFDPVTPTELSVSAAVLFYNPVRD
uniref:Mediator of RNA polymerase II transcription subunit 4 n=1 Tax=Heterorhabditis bacteriophora TaxID=37862 RepID=A0A1I7XHA6_HETBA